MSLLKIGRPMHVRRRLSIVLAAMMCAFAGIQAVFAAPPVNGEPPLFSSQGKPHFLPVHPVRSSGSASVTRTASTAHLNYYGGPVVSNMQVVIVLWGTGTYLPELSGSPSTGSMTSFYTQALNSSYVDWLSEYNTSGQASGTGQTIGRTTTNAVNGPITITPSTSASSSTIDDSVIQTELQAQIASGILPKPTADAQGYANTYYALFFPKGTSISLSGSGNSCASGGFCAYHGTIAYSSNVNLLYGVHPDLNAGICSTGCGGSAKIFDNQTSVASHEMVETMTDPGVGLACCYAPPMAWYDQTNGEIGDICNGQQGTLVGADSITYTVQKEWSNAAGSCIVSQAPSDFSLSAASTLSVVVGTSSTLSISTAVAAGASGSVALSVSGAPPGATATLSPTSVTAGSSSTLTFNAGTASVGGPYTLTMTGVEGAATHSITVAVTVVAKPDFTISALTSPLSVVQNAKVTSSISTAVASGSSAASVALALTSNLPSGASASLSPSSVTAGNSATLTVNGGTGGAGNAYSVTVTGTETGGSSHAVTVPVTITAAPPADFSISTNPTTLTFSYGSGSSQSTKVQTSVVSGSGTVKLTVSGCPTNARCQLSSSSINAGSSTTLKLYAKSNSGASSAKGTSTVTVTGVEGVKTHATTVGFTIQ